MVAHLRHTDRNMLDSFLDISKTRVSGAPLRPIYSKTPPLVGNRKMRRAFRAKLRALNKKNTSR
jgi:hypothetical protein